MSVVEDVRQVLQDFIAPELRAVNTRLDAIESKFDTRFTAIDQRFDDMRTIMKTHFDSLGKDVAQVKEMLDIDRRLTRLESKQSAVSQ
jgi:tetrahydromethanopterin S-methyltransferase subunit G